MIPNLLAVAISHFFCSIVLAAAPPALAFPGRNPIEIPSHASNLTLPHVLSSLPQDPLYYDVPHSLGQTIKFYSYGPSLHEAHIVECLLAAATEVISHLQDPNGGEQEIGNQELKYHVGNVFLVLHPGIDAPMTWSMWSYTISGLYWFGKEYGFLDFEFDVAEAGHLQAVGTGMLGSL